MKLSNIYPLLNEGLKPKDCYVCRKECYPDKYDENGDLLYNIHHCNDGKNQIMMKRLKVSSDGNINLITPETDAKRKEKTSS